MIKIGIIKKVKISNFLMTALRPAKKMLLISGILAGIAGLSNAGLLALLNHALGKQNHFSITIIIAYFLLLLVVFISDACSQTLFSKISQSTTYELTINLCNQIISTPLREIEKIGPSKLLAMLTEDISTIGMAALALPMILINCIIVVACFIYLYLLSSKIFLAVIFFMLISLFSFIIIDIQFVNKRFELARSKTDKLFAGFQSMFGGIKEIKLNYNKRTEFLEENIIIPSAQYRDNITAAMKNFSFMQSGWRATFFMLIGFVLFILPNFSDITSVVLSQSILVVLFLISPLSAVMAYYPNISRTVVALNKVNELSLNFNSLNFDEQLDTRQTGTSNWKELCLSGVTHAYQQEYNDKEFTLGPIDIKFYPGEIVFLVGKNGCGKSTLAKLMTGLYKPESGSIVLDQSIISAANIMWYRQHFFTVFSDYYLFNKLYGIDRKDIEQKVGSYLIQLQLDHKVKFENNGFSSVDLSEGQRKRLALLAAYLEDRPIYIFDEWASNQDPLFKEIFYTQLIPDLKNNNKCIIVISHDENYFSIADRIIVLEEGKVKSEKINYLVE